MILEEKGYDKLLRVYEELGFDEKQMEMIEGFLECKVDREVLKAQIKNDFTNHQISILYSRSDSIAEIYHENKELAYKHMFIIYCVLKDEFHTLWSVARLCRKCEDGFTLYSEIGVPFEGYIINKAKSFAQGNNEYYSNEDNEFGYIYKNHHGEFMKALLAAKDIDIKAMLTMIMLAEDKNGISGNMLDGMYNKNILEFLLMAIREGVSPNGTEKDVEDAMDYIEGKTDIFPKKIQFTYLRDKHESLVSLCYILRDLEMCDRTFELLLNSISDDVFSRLVYYLDSRSYYRSRYDENITNELYKFSLGSNLRKKEFMKWIAKQSMESYRSLDSKDIEKYYKLQKDIYEEATAEAEDSYKIVMVNELIKDGKGAEYKDYIEAYVENQLKEFMSSESFEQKDIDAFNDYIEGKIEIEKIKLPKGFRNKYLYSNKKNLCYSVGILRKLVSEDRVNRIIKYLIFLGIHNTHFVYTLVEKLSQQDDKSYINKFVNICRDSNVDEVYINALLMTILGDQDSRAIICKKINREINSTTKEEIKIICESFKYCQVLGKEALLEFTGIIITEKSDEIVKEAYEKMLKASMEESAKGVKEQVILSLKKYGKGKQIAIDMLKSKKASAREVAVDMLSTMLDDEIRENFASMVEGEKSSKVKNKIYEAIGGAEDDGQTEDSNDGELSIDNYCEKYINKNKKTKVKWIDRADMPKMRYSDSEEEISEVVFKHLFITYSDTDGITLNPEGENIASYINREDLENAAYSLLNIWLNNGADAKKKWVLIFAAIYGDRRTINILQKNIKEWPEVSRGTMATYAVKALGLNGSDEALLFIDGLSRKFKFKQVKKAAAEALEIAAKELNIHPEELSDRLIPTLGFDESGEQVFDYGTRKFTVILSNELTLEVHNEDGKKLNNLPAVGKKDDPEMANKAREEFKVLKKQLKNVVQIQRDRLELALSINRKWTAEKWNKLFVDNNIMHKFATGLIWGVYDGEELKDSFRYMEDGTFNTYDEEEFLMEEYKEMLGDIPFIGLVHPIELEEDVLEQWKEQLEDYEVEQPLPQLHREIFKVTEEEIQRMTIERFAGLNMNGISLLGKLSKYQWEKGSIQDAGGYYEFCKEIGDIGVELNMSGLWVGMSAYDGEEAMIFEYAFYKAGQVRRGSYVYDKVSKDTVINPKDVPARIFSEIAYDLSKVTEKCVERDENWKKHDMYSGVKLS
ncbi:DUF4132 domain-containing protein [Oceanirhabdus sp. W0125-5]|uniref:DUF4132 domain-containing protein n=1 Tax=Oceanirhabdus sp. W0125-5 TaxID=2999116 RepID=UPI0022F2F26D|nr:DUF4132 domain-containing protein [Oceanirhabdus sp. W0125-5]WBW96984.1 DUF4132 domain-containing protein [Oceanirhabdus sp. W0125-5]